VICDDDALTSVISVGLSGMAAGVIENAAESGPSPYMFTADIWNEYGYPYITPASE